jgi:polyferredoxin
MASNVVEVIKPVPSAPGERSVAKSLLLTLPMALWAILMFMQGLMNPKTVLSYKLAAVITIAFMTTLFFLMMKTSETHRWRRWYFIALGYLFPIGFIYHLVIGRGSMGIPMEEMIAGRTPFCPLPIPTVIPPAVLFKTVIFPGSILTGHGAAGSGIAAMVGLWLALTLVLGKGWCSYACFFGGIEEGCSAVAKRPKIKKLDGRWRYGSWAVLLAVVLLSLATFEPAYCMWLCPFKAVTEYVAANNLIGYIQNGLFILLFTVLVIVLPLLTKKRTQCAFFCPFGAFQSLFNKISIFDVRIDRTKCNDCRLCQSSCPTMAISDESVAKGETLIGCMKCGACVDRCNRGAAVWHIKGTDVAVKPERARLLFLYSAWALAVMFGGSIIAGSVQTLLHWVI